MRCWSAAHAALRSPRPAALFLDHARLALLPGRCGRRSRASRRPAGEAGPSRSVFLPVRSWCGCRRRCAYPARRAAGTSRSRWRASHRRSLRAYTRCAARWIVAFLRREKDAPGIAFKPLIREPLVAVLPAGHRLAVQKAVRLQDLADEIYITPTRVAPALKAVIENYAARSGVMLKPQYDAEKHFVSAFAGDVDGWRDPDCRSTSADAAVVSCHSPAAGAMRRLSNWFSATIDRILRHCSSGSWRGRIS